jgi:hypothetical protein
MNLAMSWACARWVVNWTTSPHPAPTAQSGLDIREYLGALRVEVVGATILPAVSTAS